VIQRVRIALEVSMEDDLEAQKELAQLLGLAVIDAATEYGVDLGQTSSIVVTTPGGATHREVIV